jgi:hypothetical protein
MKNQQLEALDGEFMYDTSRALACGSLSLALHPICFIKALQFIPTVKPSKVDEISLLTIISINSLVDKMV